MKALAGSALVVCVSLGTALFGRRAMRKARGRMSETFRPGQMNGIRRPNGTVEEWLYRNGERVG